MPKIKSLMNEFRSPAASQDRPQRTTCGPLIMNPGVPGAAILLRVTFTGLTPSAFSKYSTQRLSAGLKYADKAMLTQPANTYATTGLFGRGLTIAYAVYTSVAFMNIVIQLKLQDFSDNRDFISIIPELLMSSRAISGTGVLRCFGSAGMLAAISLNGNPLPLRDSISLLHFLARSDNLRACEVR